MRFCPKCGGLLMPSRRGDKTILKCSKCGFEIDTSSSSSGEYRLTLPTEASSRVMTTSIVSEGKVRSRSREEIEQEKEEYYKELFLELLREEEYGSEEGG